MFNNNVQTLSIANQILAALPLPTAGSGSPAIFIHGITSSIYFWQLEEVLAPFQHLGPAYALSLPAHYPAQFPPGFAAADLSGELIGEVLTSAVRQLVGNEPVTLVGHSTGGFAALVVAQKLGAQVRQVISISGFAHGRWTGGLGLYQDLVRRGGLGQSLYKLLYRGAQRSRRFFKASARMYAANPEAVYTHPNYETGIDRTWPAFQQLDLNGMVLYFQRMPEIDVSDGLAQIQAPTLALTGDKDPIVPPIQSALIAERVPNARLGTIPSSGHLPFWENTSAYEKALRDWFSREKTQPA